MPAIATAATRHTNIIARTHFFPIASGSFLKLLGAELRDGDYGAEARLTPCDYRKSQTNWPLGAVHDLMRQKQARKFETQNGMVATHEQAYAVGDHGVRRAITKLIDSDAIALAPPRFSLRKPTLLWLGDSSVVDADTL